MTLDSPTRIRSAALAVLVALPSVFHGEARGQEPAMEAGQEVVVAAVEVRGNDRQPAEFVEAEAGIRPGARIRYADIQDAIHRLWRTGQYADVRVYAAPVSSAQDSADVIIEVEERPFVAFIDFEGLKHVSGRTVRDTVGLRSGAPLNPSRVTEAEQMIRELLADEGIRARRVEHEVEPIPDFPGEYRLVFRVEEGARVAIADIEFEDNEVFTDEELEGVIATRREGFLWFRTGTFDETVLRQDLRQNLPSFYGENGYLDFVVEGDSLVVDPRTGKGRLIVAVSEGSQYRLLEFEIRGNRRFSTEDLRAYFETSRGGLLQSFGIGRSSGQDAEDQPVFDLDNFEAATEDIRQLYRNNGYLYAQVSPYVERTHTDEGEAAVRVGWDVREGEPAFINRVSIRGNTFTHEDVIRDRIMLVPGDIYNEELLIQSYRSIMGLGFFESPLPLPQIDQKRNGDVNVTFEVEEKQTGSINFGTSVGGFGGLAGFIGYDQPNLFGQAKAGHLRGEWGRYTQNFEASYTDPAIRGSRISGSVSLFSTRDNRFFRFSEGQRRRTGASLQMGLPFPLDRRFTRAFIGYSLSRTTYERFQGVDPTSIFGLPPAVQSRISIGLRRNTLDSPLFPTVGSRQELVAELNGGPLGGDGNFQKYTASGSWYVPVGSFGSGQPGVRPVRMTLGLTADAGAITGNVDLFPFESFWMGGVLFGNSLRGYEETSITPFGYFDRSDDRVALRDRLGKAFFRLSSEWAIRLNDNISLQVFGDAGSLWQDVSDVNTTRLFRGAGVGITLVTPFGPLGLDYAYGFDKPDPGWQLHFKFGPGI